MDKLERTFWPTQYFFLICENLLGQPSTPFASLSFPFSPSASLLYLPFVSLPLSLELRTSPWKLKQNHVSSVDPSQVDPCLTV